MTVPLGELIADYVSENDCPINDQERNTILHSTIDTFGCILVGAQDNVSRMCRDALAKANTGDRFVYGSALKTSPEKAAFLNAVSAHALDLDDWELPGNSHASAVIMPALLAAAAHPITTDQYYGAYKTGFELIARIGEAINFEHYNRGWHTTGTIACIGATAAICHLWRLNKTKTLNAICLSVSRASGLFRQFGSLAKPLQAGFAAENAMNVCQLARAGITAQPTIFEGPQGYFALTGNNDEPRHRRALSRLGSTPSALAYYGQVLKPYAMCGYTIRIIGCAQQMAKAGIEMDAISSITIELPDFHANILPFKQPANHREAMFSLPFAVAMGFLEGGVTLSHHHNCAWECPNVKRLIKLCEVSPFAPGRPDLNYDPNEPDRLKVTLTNGTQHTFLQDYPLGAPQNPMSLDEVVNKFLDNACRFRRPSPDQLKQFVSGSSDDFLYTLNQIGVN